MVDFKSEDILAEYFRRMAEIRSTGATTSETSYYTALENLLNALGGQFKPAVICNGQLRNQGAGHPDFGLYTKDQLSKGEPLLTGKGLIPARGVIEVKPLKDKSWQTAKSIQATKYFNHYRLVLITNYRDFRLIGEDEEGNPVEREFFSLADSEEAFWILTAKPGTAAKNFSAHFDEFLQRVLMSNAPLTRAEDIAWFLASYAREALKTLEEKDASTLKPLKDALETALGTTFRGDKGTHFFKSTLVQTLFYGVFSAWVIAAREGNTIFDWRTTAHILTVPMIRSLFEEMAKPTRLQPLGLTTLLDRTGDALNRVDKETFFKSFDTGLAVQHFYEPFLQAFDPELRKDLGVWYTPPEIVQYMVERVDRALRSELGIADGLADKNVYVLDPCCGTGAYLVEVLRRIERTHKEKGVDALMGEDIKEAAQKRIFGFELLPASFVVAHWQIGNLLSEINAPLDAAKHERPAIYLTNALTGWEPPTGAKATIGLFPELEEERDAAEHVKRDVPILVVLGNPPYNAYAGTSPEEEQGLVKPYKEGLVKKWGIKKFNLDELYVRFFRIAERRIATSGRGIVSYISNYSYVSEKSFVVMRENLLKSFDKIWIDNMHGDRNKSEYAPDGRTSETIFAIRGFSPGIRQGVVISLAVKTGADDKQAQVFYRDNLQEAKADARRNQLLQSLDDPYIASNYVQADPQPINRHSFRPVLASANYLSWPKVDELTANEPINGLMEKRGGALINMERETLEKRMKLYLSKEIDWEEYCNAAEALKNDASRFDAKAARKKLLEEGYKAEQLVPYIVRPFDERFCYYTSIRPLWNEPRPTLWNQYLHGTQFLMTRPSGVASPEGSPFFFTRHLGDNDALRGHAYYIPFIKHEAQNGLLAATQVPNLSTKAKTYLKELHCEVSTESSELVWLHTLAIGYAPEYLSENAQGISNNWPRIPLPNSKEQLEVSAALGRKLAALLDADAPHKIPDYAKLLGVISSTDLAVTANWGRLDKVGRVNPGKGKVEKRAYTKEELTILGGRENKLGAALDIYLNDNTCWRCVPEAVWEYYIGGYQPIKKWLSYREKNILGRDLTKDEARYITDVIRRIAAIILLSSELDQNYTDCRDNPYTWPISEVETVTKKKTASAS